MVTEWLKVLAWKASVLFKRVPRVRIPPTPLLVAVFEKLLLLVERFFRASNLKLIMTIKRGITEDFNSGSYPERQARWKVFFKQA